MRKSGDDEASEVTQRTTELLIEHLAAGHAGDLGGQAFQSSVELDQDAGRLIGFRFDRFRADAF